MNNLQKLKKAIIKEIPEGTEHEGVICYECKKKLKLNGYGLYTVTIITLADVLSILETMYEDDRNGNTRLTSQIPEIKMVLDRWEFSKGSLENQSKPTIDFLTDLICKDE